MSKLDFIMLVGLPGSGKSTWIKKHIEKNQDKNYHIISLDDVIEEMGKEDGIGYNEAYKKFCGKAEKTMKARAKEAFKAGRNVIWDQTNMSVKNRKGKMAMADDRYEFTAVVFSIPDNVLKERLEGRAKETGKSIPMFVVNNMAKTYQEPSRSEGFSKVIRVKN